MFSNFVVRIMKVALGILCSLLILLSSMGITISNHYCGNEFQKQSVLGIPIEQNQTAHSCGDLNDDNCCADNTENEKCCTSDRQIVEADIDFFKTSQKDHKIDFGVVIERFQTLFIATLKTEKVLIQSNPFVERDRPVLFQSFLC